MDIDIECANCNNLFITKDNRRKYCSKGCYYKNRKDGDYLKCLTCEKKFYCHKKSKQKYCSYQCDKKSRNRLNKGQYIKCFVCKSNIYIFPSQTKKDKKFCSRKCWHGWMKGVNIPFYGKKHKIETIKANRNKHLGKKLSNEHKLKISIAP